MPVYLLYGRYLQIPSPQQVTQTGYPNTGVVIKLLMTCYACDVASILYSGL